MERQRQKRSTSHNSLIISRRFVALLLFFALLFMADSYLITRKSNEFKAYTEVEHKLSLLLTHIVRVEYMLDIFVVARHLEEGVPEAIIKDVKKIDREIDEIISAGTAKLFGDDGENRVYRDIVESIQENWSAVKDQIKRLSIVETEEEALLVHNSVDTHTMMLSEDIERLMSFMEEHANTTFAARRNYILFALFVSLALCVGAGGVFMYRVLLPQDRLRIRMMSVLNDERYAIEHSLERDASMNELFDSIVDGMDRLLDERASRISQLEQRLKRMERHMVSVNIIAATMVTSISHQEVFSAAIEEVLKTTGAYGCAVYIKEGVHFKLAACGGFTGGFNYSAEQFPANERDSFRTDDIMAFEDVGGYPDGRLKRVLLSEGVKSYLVVPLLCGSELGGYMDVAFKERFSPEEEDLLYLSSVATHCGVAMVHSVICLEERKRRMFVERVVEHLPCGVAVFDRGGRCLVANDEFRRLVGYEPQYEMEGNYNLFEDAQMEELGILPHLRSIFDGNRIELELKPTGRDISLRVKGCPVYEAGGAISSILLMCETLKEEAKKG